MTHRRTPHATSVQTENERRVRASVFLGRLTVADGEWLRQTLPALQRHAHPEPQAVRIEDVSLRYRAGRLGIADALDATATLLEPFAAAGAAVDRRGEWYISDDEDDDAEELFHSERAASLGQTPQQDLLVSARVIVDAAGEDAGAAALYWAVLVLAQSEV